MYMAGVRERVGGVLGVGEGMNEWLMVDLLCRVYQFGIYGPCMSLIRTASRSEQSKV